MQNAAGFHGLNGVLDHVVKNLFELVAIQIEQRQLFIQIHFDEDIAVANLCLKEGDRFFENVVQLLRGESRCSGPNRSQKLMNDRIKTLDLALRDVEQLSNFLAQAWRRFPELSFDELQMNV